MTKTRRIGILRTGDCGATEPDPAVQVAPASGLETVAEAGGRMGKRRIGILRKDGEAAPATAAGTGDGAGFTSADLSGIYLVGASGSAVAGDGAEAESVKKRTIGVKIKPEGVY
jgi:hypothetical protein